MIMGFFNSSAFFSAAAMSFLAASAVRVTRCIVLAMIPPEKSFHSSV
jgi:hypothetical protein